jgi:hypothetical protein
MKKTIFTFGTCILFGIILIFPFPGVAALRAPIDNVLQPMPSFVRPDISNNINSNRAPSSDIENTEQIDGNNESGTPRSFSDESFSLPWWRISIVLALIILFILLQRSRRGV